MSQIQSGSEATAAALVGSLATFTLFDVLELLARTNHTGELQVVGRGIDQRIYIDRGDLLDRSGEGSHNSALFELACIEDGWFYFTLMGSVPDNHDRIPVVSVLADLGPQVEEWRNLVAYLPFDARVSMSSSAPAPAVQVRSDQWHLLGLIGSPGRTIRAVLDVSDSHPLETLRTLRELIDAHLVSLSLSTPSMPVHAAPVGLYEPSTPTPSAYEPSPYESQARESSTDTWMASAGTRSAEAEGDGRATPEDDDTGAPALVAPPPPAASGPPAPPEGWVERDEASLAGPNTGPESEHAALTVLPTPPVAVESPNGSAMPPPITGDPWSATGSHVSQQPEDDADLN